MDNSAVLSVVYLVALVAFVVPLFVGAATTIARVVFYARHGEKRPRLLTRDAFVIGGLAVTFLLISVARVAGLGPVVRESVPWAIATSIPAVVGAITYAYYELFVIERPRRTE